MKNPKIAIIGATGNVGREILTLLAERGFGNYEVHGLASGASHNKQVSFGSKVINIKSAENFDFTTVDIVFFAICGSLSKQYYQKVFDAGCVIIDNSSAFRMEEGVPLIVADVNLAEVKNYTNKNIIANSNCVTSPLALALKPLEEYGINRIVASTYQSVSGAGKRAMDELYSRTKAFYEVSISGKEVKEKDGKEVFTKDIAFNCIPHIDIFLEDGRTKEEWKMEVEIQKILNNQNIKVSSTCVRVPVFVGHSIAASIEFENNFDFEDLEDRLAEQTGIVMMDRRQDGGYITPRETVRTTGVYVSRVRRDHSVKNGISLWLSADNVYGIGAAYNAVRIFEELIKLI